MSEILCVGVGSLVKACPQLSRIELHAESLDFEGGWFDEVVVNPAAGPSGYNTRQTTKHHDDMNNSNAITQFLSDMQAMALTLTSRHSARMWRESLTPEALLKTRWYAEIQHLSGLQEATLMLSQNSFLWEGHSTAEETNFSFNLWKIRWLFLVSATRPRWGKSDLLLSLVHGDGNRVSEERLREGGHGEGHGLRRGMM